MITITDNAKKYLMNSNKTNIIIQLNERINWEGYVTRTAMVLAVKNYVENKNYIKITINNYNVLVDMYYKEKLENITIDTDEKFFHNSLKITGIADEIYNYKFDNSGNIIIEY